MTNYLNEYSMDGSILSNVDILRYLVMGLIYSNNIIFVDIFWANHIVISIIS